MVPRVPHDHGQGQAGCGNVARHPHYNLLVVGDVNNKKRAVEPGGDGFGLLTKQREASVIGLEDWRLEKSKGRRWDVAVKREMGLLPTLF